MRYFTTFIFTLTVCLTFGQTIPHRAANKKCKIEIYLIEKIKTDTTKQCRYCFLPAVIDLADSAFIKDGEIAGYEVADSQYYLILSEECQKRLYNLTKTTGNFPVRCAFAVVLNGQPIYGGWFLNQYVSNFYACDWVYIFTPFGEDSPGKLRIDLRYPRHQAPAQFEEDPRNNKLIIDCL